MSSSPPSNPSSHIPKKEAPWRSLFLSHVSQLSTPVFTLATISSNVSSSASSTGNNAPGIPNTNTTNAPPTPRARTCVLRGLFGSFDPAGPNPQNPAPMNPLSVYESDLPVFTTDVRMSKVAELESNPAVEAVWWVEASKTQWRVRGRACVLDGEDKFRDVVLPRMRKVAQKGNDCDDDDRGGWSWEREVTAHFGNLSPAMRGSFKKPPPGLPVAEGDGGGLKLGEKVEHLDDEVARRNFRVVVIVPDEVDQVLLEEIPRRWLYVYRGENGKVGYKGGEMLGEWERVEVWP